MSQQAQLAHIRETLAEVIAQPEAPERIVAIGFIPERRLPQAMFTFLRRRQGRLGARPLPL